MRNIQHTVMLYQKPKIGNNFIRRMRVYNYRHSINAIGGFDTASCDIAIRSREEGQQFLDQYIGNRVAFYVDNPVEPIWEGFINRMTFSAGGVEYSIGLDEMANRILANWTNPAISATSPQTSANSDDTSSQAIYGIKQDQVDLGLMSNTATAPSNIRATMLAQRAFPKTSILPAGNSGGGLLHIELLGFFHTLEWERYSDTNTTDMAINTYLTTILGALANGTTFFDNSVTSGVIANAITLRRESIRGETAWERMQMAAEIGDGTNYYIIGLTPTSFSAGTRTFYYQAFNSTVVYTARQFDGLRIRNLYGQLVDPWRVRPDNGIRVSDMLIGWNGVGDNPTETYIKKIDYDANRQSCIYSGDDDLSAEGVFNLKTYNKSHGKRFGAVRRVI